MDINNEQLNFNYKNEIELKMSALYKLNDSKNGGYINTQYYGFIKDDFILKYININVKHYFNGHSEYEALLYFNYMNDVGLVESNISLNNLLDNILYTYYTILNTRLAELQEIASNKIKNIF